MQLNTSAWPEIEAYLKKCKGIIIPIGSVEQHGPNGLLGTDAICPEVIAKEAGDEAGFLVGPTFSVGSAQHHLGFTGTKIACTGTASGVSSSSTVMAEISPRLMRPLWKAMRPGHLMARPAPTG